ncbi:TPA: hypothetical protein ACJXXT_000165 [Pseudomonas aeruginosa]
MVGIFKQDIKTMFVAYASLTAVFALTFPEKAVSKAYPVEYFVGERIAATCPDGACVSDNDIFKVDLSNVVVSVYKNRHYDNRRDCENAMGFYKERILKSSFFPLASSKVDFGGVFTLGKDSYHAKMKCDDNFMIAKITKI